MNTKIQLKELGKLFEKQRVSDKEVNKIVEKEDFSEENINKLADWIEDIIKSIK